MRQPHPYLLDRGLEPTTIAEFGLGFCRTGSLAGRIVIPIHNAEGQLVAYAGRWPGDPPDGIPKYKLPKGFRKSLELFNLDRAIAAAGDGPLVVVEGYFGCIHLWQAGIHRVVALMGSALSQFQEALIRRHMPVGDKILVLLDEDLSGRAGRADIVQRLGANYRVAVYQFEREGQQPDDLSAMQLELIRPRISVLKP